MNSTDKPNVRFSGGRQPRPLQPVVGPSLSAAHMHTAGELPLKLDLPVASLVEPRSSGRKAQDHEHLCGLSAPVILNPFGGRGQNRHH